MSMGVAVGSWRFWRGLGIADCGVGVVNREVG